jgi:hypothetical protein
MTKVDTRQPNISLTESQLNFFYGILVFCESGAFSQVKININNRLIKSHQYDEKKNPQGIKLLYPTKGKSSNIKEMLTQMQSNHNNIIVFANQKRNVCKSLLCHIRNAFAHNRIIRENNDILFLTDEHSGTLSMKGLVKFKVFKELVNEIINVGKNSLNSK